MREIEKITIVEKSERIYESSDGMQFRSRDDCCKHEEELKRKAICGRKDIISSNCYFAPVSHLRMLGHDYKWFRPLTLDALAALADAFPSNQDIVKPQNVNQWLCVELDESNRCQWFRLTDDLRQVHSLCKKLGIDIKVYEVRKRGVV